MINARRLRIQPVPIPPRRLWAAGLALIAGLSLGSAHAQSTASTSGTGASTGTQAATEAVGTQGPRQLNQSPGRQPSVGSEDEAINLLPPAPPGEFEAWVHSRQGGAGVDRFGARLITDAAGLVANRDPLPVVPPDYIIKPGDEVDVTIWGSVDAQLHLVVDRTGRVSLPRVGSVMVAGLRHADLADALTKRVGATYREFQLTASLGRLRAMRVFVTGHAAHSGAITVSGLSTVLQVMMRAGGPSAAGSFRDIRLIRAGKELARFDLYDLLLKGDRGTDMVVQGDDVIHVNVVGPQVAVLGSVNQPAIYELRPGETLADVMRMVGGFTPVADRSRVAIERMAEHAGQQITQLPLQADIASRTPLNSGDIVRVFSAVQAQQGQERSNRRVRVEGEVAHAGEYILPPGSTLADAVAAAGGTTSSAYLYATELSRESVRVTQQDNFERAVHDLEIGMAKMSAATRSATTDDAMALTATASSQARLVERMRTLRPTGRLVLELQPNARELPPLLLEDGDRLYIPARNNSAGVFGSVFSPGSFLFDGKRSLKDYLLLAGGPTEGADTDSIFIVHANGTVASTRQASTFWHDGDEILNAAALPGDTLFVPEKIGRTTFTQGAKDWGQILSQFGIGIAAIRSLTR